MSSENDVPLGGESRRYYEQKFGSRIRQVSKGGNVPNKGGGSNWNGRAGAGIAIGVVFIIIRIVIALSRTESHTPSYTSYTPPPEKFGIRQVGGELAFPPIPFQQPAANPPARFDELLDDHDIPLFEGLCYRIHHESLQPELTPGGRICQLLDASTRKLIVKAVDGHAMDGFEAADVLIALTNTLFRPDFSDTPAFNTVPGFVVLRQTRKDEAAIPAMYQYNRKLLEMCYPNQVVPLRDRDNLTDQAREQWRKRAQADLAKARQKYEPAKR